MSQHQEALVSAVIPTYKRPQYLLRAVRSALAQTLRNIEVIVVVDGPHDPTLQALSEIRDERLRVEVLAQNRGTAVARNTGVRLARSPWNAHLDDDDEWLPQKIELQLQVAQASAYRYPIVACRFIARTEHRDFVWPRRTPRPKEPLSQYLFCRSTPFFGEGVLPSTSLFISTELLRKSPVNRDWPPLEDVDWILRAIRVPGAGLEFVQCDAPLAIWNREQARHSGTTSGGWQRALHWIQRNRELVTPRAYAGPSVLAYCAGTAARRGQREAFWPLLREAFAHGRPRPMDVMTCVAHGWCVPYRSQARLAALAARIRRPAPHQDEVP